MGGINQLWRANENSEKVSQMDMSNPLTKQWQTLKRGKPGERFAQRYEAGQKVKKAAGPGFKLLRVVRILIALGSVVVGVILVFIPGPAILFFLISGSLLAAESLTIARFLDWTELKLRAAFSWSTRHWRRLHLAGKIALSGLVATGAGGFAYVAYRLMAG